jgi:dTDP-L-rhamnose 4-epimerase
MRVLVTGGAGFVGQYLARRLVGAGHQVAALDLLRPQVHADPGAAVSSFPGDVVDQARAARAGAPVPT